MTPTHKPPFLVGGIADLLRWVELLIFTVSAPVLSVATVIAVVDLLTGGRLLATQPNLVFAFGVALAIGIDSQLPAACERVRDAWEGKRWFTLLLWAVIALWTGLVIFTALRAFSIEQAQHVDETTALNLIGFDPGLFATQRDLLAVVLLGLSGFARVKARPVSRAEERAELEKELELEPLRQQLESVKAHRAVALVSTGREMVEALRTPNAANGTPQPEGFNYDPSQDLSVSGDTDKSESVEPPTKPPTGPGTPINAPRPRRAAASVRTDDTRVLDLPTQQAQRQRRQTAARATASRAHGQPTQTATERQQKAAQTRTRRLEQVAAWVAEDPAIATRELVRRLQSAEHSRVSESTVGSLRREVEARGLNPSTSSQYAQ